MLDVWDTIMAVVIMAAVIMAAYYVTKLVAKTGGGGGFRRSGSSIKVIASQSLGREKSVTIVEIGDNAYILGVSAQRVELLDKLQKTELNLKNDAGAPTTPTFGASFREELNKRLNRPPKND